MQTRYLNFIQDNLVLVMSTNRPETIVISGGAMSNHLSFFVQGKKLFGFPLVVDEEMRRGSVRFVLGNRVLYSANIWDPTP